MKRKFKLLIPILILLIVSLLTGCTNSTGKSENSQSLNNEMKVHYINIGQGDATLITVNGKNMLIDSGSQSDETELLDYLHNLKITKLDYVIATHPHEDHIGNMDKVIDDFEIGEFYAPKATSTTKTFQNMINSLKKKNLKINTIKDGTNDIDLGPDTKVDVFSPKADLKEKDLNNYSPIMKITYGENSFLFTGDAEKDNEDYVLSKGYNISSDVLKAGHHGSSTSSSQNFLTKVNPSLTIISCGVDNKYGHPHKETLEKLNKINSKVYRTDKDGTITLVSNGTDIWRAKN